MCRRQVGLTPARPRGPAPAVLCWLSCARVPPGPSSRRSAAPCLMPRSAAEGGFPPWPGWLLSAPVAVWSGAGSAAVFAEPAGQFAGPADRAQPAFGLVPHRGGGDDEQPVACPQGGRRGGDESLAVADDQGDVGLGGKPQLEDLHPVQS